MVTTILHLPPYPSLEARAKLSASQVSSLFQTIASTLEVVIFLPPEKRDTPSSRDYISTYAHFAAFRALQNLIWKDDKNVVSAKEIQIRKLSLALAEKVVGGLDVHVLLDLATAYAKISPVGLQKIFSSAEQSNPSLSQTVTDDFVPSFTLLLNQQTPTSQGLYAQRKVAECIYAFLRASKTTPALVRPFCHNKEFVISLATLYANGMSAIAVSYGGLPALAAGISGQAREADDWEKIWIETKVALIDAFHILILRLLEELASLDGAELAVEVERTFGLVFALLENVPASSTLSDDITSPTPFLNQSLLADYQQCYSLSKTLSKALSHAKEKDVRLDVLESTLQSLDHPQSHSKNPGALKILLRSSGMPSQKTFQSSQNPTPRSFTPVPVDKDKRAADPHQIDDDPDSDIKASQILDILPDTPLSYVRLLLAHERYGQNPEKVVEALLEGTAPSEEELEQQKAQDGMGSSSKGKERAIEPPDLYDVVERRNVFDDDALDINQLRIGKKMTGSEVLRDRSFVQEMKANILRRVEMISDDEEDEDVDFDPYGDSTNIAASGSKKQKAPAVVLGPDDDDLDDTHVSVAGDGEDTSDAEGSEDDDDEVETAATPDTMIEQAYLRDPKVFERDAATRRGKDRAQLKTQTGWDDGQIEGWKVMLDRTPKGKEKLMEKYAFTGNRRGPIDMPSAQDGRGGGRGRARGGRGGRGGGGRGGRGRGGGGGDATARERAWKDKNKSSRANHDRKRGHDKKMARAGPGPST
ncbi:hypothetical protein CPB83DRAFT_813976 [Crepidotus variabilis]|uniref:CUE domain-containing protein n=1 Tax=Crepidotus variabilis TaxID=179855 RepID=A0A9P6EF38_9AGAR|nr:hypothetical protein CPB83DRAFT_813976 [Crepidotus variabilis]